MLRSLAALASTAKTDFAELGKADAYPGFQPASELDSL